MKIQNLFKHEPQCFCQACTIQEVKNVYTMRGFLMALFWFALLVIVVGIVGEADFNTGLL